MAISNLDYKNTFTELADENGDGYNYLATPMEFYKNEKYRKNLTSQSRELYALIRYRWNCSLSNKKNWTDENGKVFCHFSVEELADTLNISKSSVIRHKKILRENKLIMERTVRDGSNRIYLFKVHFKKVSLTSDTLENAKNSTLENVKKEYSNNSDLYPIYNTISNNTKKNNNINILCETSSPTMKQISLINSEVKINTNIDNELLIKSTGYKEYIEALKKKVCITGYLKKLFAYKKLDEAIANKNYNKMTPTDFTYLFKDMYEAYYGEKYQVYSIYDHTDMKSFIAMFKLNTADILDVFDGLFYDYEELGYKNEAYPKLNLKTLSRDVIIKPLMDGKPWKNWSSNKRDNSKYTADGLLKSDIEDLEKFQRENPELMELSDKEY